MFWFLKVFIQVCLKFFSRGCIFRILFVTKKFSINGTQRVNELSGLLINFVLVLLSPNMSKVLGNSPCASEIAYAKHSQSFAGVELMLIICLLVFLFQNYSGFFSVCYRKLPHMVIYLVFCSIKTLPALLLKLFFQVYACKTFWSSFSQSSVRLWIPWNGYQRLFMFLTFYFKCSRENAIPLSVGNASGNPLNLMGNESVTFAGLGAPQEFETNYLLYPSTKNRKQVPLYSDKSSAKSNRVSCPVSEVVLCFCWSVDYKFLKFWERFLTACWARSFYLDTTSRFPMWKISLRLSSLWPFCISHVILFAERFVALSYWRPKGKVWIVLNSHGQLPTIQ